MEDRIVTIKSFHYYLECLQRAWGNDRNPDVLAEPFVYEAIRQTFSNYSIFSEKADYPVSELANYFYECLTHYKEQFPKYYTFGLDVFNMMQFKIALRLIKYSCTIIDESAEKESIFARQDAFKLMMVDDDLNPEGWKYITDAQFRAKIRYSTGEVPVIARVCPITSVKPGCFLNFDNSPMNLPYLIISEDEYKTQIRKLFEKCLRVKKGLRFRAARCLYCGELDFEPAYTYPFSEIYGDITELKNKYSNDPKADYEIVITLDTMPSKACGNITKFKVFFFKKLEGLGYMLHCVIYGSSEEKYLVQALYTNAISKDFIADVIYAINSFYWIVQGNPNRTVVDCDMYNITTFLYAQIQEGMIKPIVPSYIIAP